MISKNDSDFLVDTNAYLPYKKITASGYTGWTNWSDDDNKRSYWGESTIYTASTDVAEKKYMNGEYDEAALAAGLVVDYKNYNELGVALGGIAYCAPNTREAFTGGFTNRATNVLVKATLKWNTAAAGNPANYQPAKLCRYAGALYTQDNFKSVVLGQMQAAGTLNIYNKTGEGSFKQITEDDVEFDANGVKGNKGDGKAVLTLIAKTGDAKYYTKNATDGYDEYTPSTDYSEFAAYVASVYNDGKMYYTIPIKHCADDTKNYYADSFTEVVGDYGVVRNHAYHITINSIGNIGHAVYNPNKDIVPNDNDSKLYWLGATINVLAWKTVNQSVNL